MKKLLAPLMALFGAANAEQLKPNVEMIDINAILYTMPTVAADSIEFSVPTPESFVGAPQFHEDEWAQLEFFSESRLGEIQKALSEHKPFEKSHRGQYGWSKIYARHITRQPLFQSSQSLSHIASSFSAELGNSPILVTTSKPLGQVKNGFSFPIAPKVNLYGLSDSSGITVLGAILEPGADDHVLTEVFSKLNTEHNLILVDWRSQMILVAVEPSGQINVWRP